MWDIIKVPGYQKYSVGFRINKLIRERRTLVLEEAENDTVYPLLCC